MNVFVDTSVWSLAFRRDGTVDDPRVRFLAQALTATRSVFTTGLILQELLQGFRGPRSRDRIVSCFNALPVLTPSSEDHIAAAELRNACRRRGIQVGTIDALLSQICIRHELTMLTVDSDFVRIARHQPLRIWQP